MEVNMVKCPSCGKETFDRKFCIFCGKKIETTKNQKSEEISQDVKNGTSRFDLGILQTRLENLLELKNRFEKELEDFDNDYKKYEAETKKDLSSLEKGRDDAKKSLEELKVLHSIEEISENNFEEKSNALTQRIKQNEKNIKDAQSQLKELKKIRKNLPKLATAEKTKKRKARNKKRIKEKLATLDLAYKDGKIGKELYEKLKAKYEEEIKK